MVVPVPAGYMATTDHDGAAIEEFDGTVTFNDAGAPSRADGTPVAGATDTPVATVFAGASGRWTIDFGAGADSVGRTRAAQEGQ
jgi:hypothetical protein